LADSAFDASASSGPRQNSRHDSPRQRGWPAATAADFALLMAWPRPAASQPLTISSLVERAGPDQVTIRAVRLDTALRLDGRLDEDDGGGYRLRAGRGRPLAVKTMRLFRF